MSETSDAMKRLRVAENAYLSAVRVAVAMIDADQRGQAKAAQLVLHAAMNAMEDMLPMRATSA